MILICLNDIKFGIPFSRLSDLNQKVD